jgi:WD40 repeat protein
MTEESDSAHMATTCTSPASAASPHSPPPHAPGGTLVGHNGWVTSIAFTPNTNEETMNMLVSCSRDKTLLKWDLLRQQGEDYGRPRLLMRGHSNFVQVGEAR